MIVGRLVQAFSIDPTACYKHVQHAHTRVAHVCIFSVCPVTSWLSLSLFEVWWEQKERAFFAFGNILSAQYL